MQLVLASNNVHKLQEVRAILTDIRILSLEEIGFKQEIEETGDTLEANSLIKARVVNDFMCAHGVEADGVLADDTGLEITALGGQPGVYTARWAGEPSNPARNREKALRLLQNENDRRAHFRTVITLIRKQGVQQVEGRVDGYIAEQESGQGGFGYDPIFIPEGYDKTFAELPAELKNEISHRARALAALKAIV